MDNTVCAERQPTKP